MNKQEYIALFHYLHPDFFESEPICSLPEEYVFDEMILPLNEFDKHKYNKKFDHDVSFGFYDSSPTELTKEVTKVEKHWVPFLTEKTEYFADM